MSFFVKMCVVDTLPEPVALGWDDRDRALAFHCGDDGVGIIGFVRNDLPGHQTLDQFPGRHTVMNLAAGQLQTHGVAQGVDDGVNLGCQPTPTAAYGLGLTPPLPPVAR